MPFDIDALATQLVRNQPYELALKCYRDDDLPGCIRLSRECDTAQSRILRVRALLGIEQPAQALRELLAMPNMITRVQQAEEAVLFGLTHLALDQVDEAWRSAKDAKILAASFEPLEAEVLTLYARLALHAGDHERAVELIHRALNVAVHDRYLPGEPSHYIMSLTQVQAQAYSLRALIANFIDRDYL